jgi:hypothetical protein
MLYAIIALLPNGSVSIDLLVLVLLVLSRHHTKGTIVKWCDMDVHVSRGTVSLLCVEPMRRARIDVYFKDICLLLLSLFVLIPIHVPSTE